LIAVTFLFGLLFFRPRLIKSKLWGATVTPLASIIGSGFLIAGPILSETAGHLAWLAMLGLCAVAYLFGAAIRHNILYLEPMLADRPTNIAYRLEEASDIVLSLAYFISVAYYLNLFAAFGLRFGDVVNPLWIRVVATVVIGAIGVVGAFGGLKALERLEVSAVGVKLSIIGGLLTALAVAAMMSMTSGAYMWPQLTHARGLNEIQSLLGLVILVQGFETSRYLGNSYSAADRVMTMRWAQWISMGIYVAFILLITPYFSDGIRVTGGETAIIDMLLPIGAAVAPMIILAALVSQLSAAIADMNGAGGLLSEASGKRLSVNYGNLMTAFVAIGITWAANIYEIITYASKAFVAYYAIQCLQASILAYSSRNLAKFCLFTTGMFLAITIFVFAIPVGI
jgi:hypothetical protein